MLKVVEKRDEREAGEELLQFDESARDGTRRMLTVALKEEAADYVERHRGEHGHALLKCNGCAQTRKLTLGAGTVELNTPRVDDCHRDESGRCRRGRKWLASCDGTQQSAISMSERAAWERLLCRPSRTSTLSDRALRLASGGQHRIETFPEKSRERSGLGQEFLFAPRAGHETVDHPVATLTMLLVGLVMHR